MVYSHAGLRDRETATGSWRNDYWVITHLIRGAIESPGISAVRAATRRFETTRGRMSPPPPGATASGTELQNPGLLSSSIVPSVLMAYRPHIVRNGLNISRRKR
jgi:hypothetical protein